MTEDGNNRLTSWARFLNALGSFGSRLVWTIIGIIVLAALGKYLFFTTRPSTEADIQVKQEAPIPEPIDWHEVDEAVAQTLQSAHEQAEIFAKARLTVWADNLQTRIDEDFLNWYFGYWQQQWSGLKSIGYWVADRKIVEKVTGEQPSMAERITAEIQEEFSKRVLRPQIAQMQIERIADRTVKTYVAALQENLATIPEKYKIPKADWERYLDDMAFLTSDIKGDRETALSLKTIVVSGAAGGTVVAVKLTRMLKPMIVKIGSKMTAKAAAKGAGKAAAKVVSKTGAKVGAKVGGKFLGAIVGLGVIIWDVWDHRHTKKIERPILRQNLADYLEELQHSLLYEPEAGLMTMIDSLQSNIISSLKTQNGAE
ncbi:MAG: hypothetical protein JSV03_05915 [Planctomycetota bacterium]|nr:MAG: hypothetical protein JSV03_05915 [Planctomycetota bacterium]